MPEMGKYIYGVINNHGIIEPLVLNKDRAGEIYTIPYEDISAVVSDSLIVDYTSLPKNNVARQLVNHQRMIEGIMMLKHTIIPMGLGIFAIDESEVRDILIKGYHLIKEIMEKIADKIEIDVCATWSDFASVLKEVGEEKDIRETKDRLLAGKEIGIDDQIKIGGMIEEALNKKRERESGEIQGSLGAVSQDFRAHELMDEKMVVNAAFLIDAARQGVFDERVNELDAQFNERLNFRCVGPLPPYSFYTLKVKRMQFEEIDWARKRLGLADKASRNEIKMAYQRTAASTHPDIKPEPGMEREFNEVTRAYKLLGDYAYACEQTSEKEIYPLCKKGVRENAILVTVNS